jgi:hypothetical protein
MSSYVTNAAWIAHAARPDTIDEIADQFERRQEGAVSFWTDVTGRRAIREAHLAPRLADRRAG